MRARARLRVRLRVRARLRFRLRLGFLPRCRLRRTALAREHVGDLSRELLVAVQPVASRHLVRGEK